MLLALRPCWRSINGSQPIRGSGHDVARRIGLCLALAAGRTGRSAGAVVAAAPDAARAEAHPLPGDPPAVRPDAEGRDAASDAVVAHPAAPGDRGFADRRT